MLRNSLFDRFSEEHFRWRGKEIFRIEALSDAVFAFSISLLVASLEVPQTFEELKSIARGAIPYFATVALLFLFWYRQYIFFRRYGLNDFRIILLNLGYLALIIFYIYPLKFLFSLLLSSWTGLDLFPKATEKGLAVLTNEEFPQLIILFSVGYLLIWLIVYAMHRRALNQSQQIGLNQVESLFTRKECRGALWNALIGAAALIAAMLGLPGLAGACYLLIPVLLIMNQQLFKRQMRRGKS
jgi:uncharacterized membrane protein